MAERPAIETRYSMLLKLFQLLRHWLDLLGTVTGMIVTFQQITLCSVLVILRSWLEVFLKLLVTTVLGLVVAIPTTLLHSFANSSARGIINVLEEQSTGIVAEHSDSK